jgi:acyl-CoA synthetase (AMP-forming)/AMP-acid ligase II
MISDVVQAADDLPLTLPKVWRRHMEGVAALGDRLLHVCDDQRLTYRQADARSRQLAKGLLAAGCSKGGQVALLYPNGPEFIIGVLAATRIGAVAVPLSTLSTPAELRWLVINSDSALVLAAPGYRSHSYFETLGKAFPEIDFTKPPPLSLAEAPWLRRIAFSGELPQGWDAGWSIAALEAAGAGLDDRYLEAVEDRVQPGDRLVIIHTSGSTSTPKGVVHQHGPLIRHTNNINEIRKLVPEDVFFQTAPWFWVAGFGFGLMGVLVAGAEIVCSNSTAPSEILDVLERERPTITNGIWRTVERLAQDPSFAGRDLSSIRRGNLYPIMAPDVRPKDPALRHDVYGASEGGGGLTLSADGSDLPEHLRSSCGPFLPGLETRIVDPETGKDVGPGEPGELWLRGPFLMEGYYGKPRSQAFDRDGWWRSADVGVISAEGFFFMKGRLGDMIKSAGANVAPREVEAVIADVSGGLASVVLGVPDPERGQAVIAVVLSEAEVDEAALRRQLAERLSSYKVPRRVIRLAPGEMPVLSSGKNDTRKLLALVQERLNPVAA